MDPFAQAVMVVLVILVVAYMMYPIYFEQYVLMRIPEYYALKTAVQESKKVLEELKSDLKKHKEELKKIDQRGGTEAELLAYQRKRIELEKRIKVFQRAATKNPGIIASLQKQLKDSSASFSAYKKLHAESTKHLKELNDQLISDFEFKDKKLAQRLQAARDTLILVMSNSKDLVCTEKANILGQLNVLVSDMSNPKKPYKQELDQLCTTQGMRKVKDDLYKNIEWGFRRAPNSESILRLYSDLENVISYVIVNKFCDADLGFRVNVFEEYVKDLINGVCGSDDWKKSTSAHLSYLLMKPATYLPGEMDEAAV